MEGSARGNYGLTDQVAALHWIQENIAEFGGDPKNVTLFGHGYGAACVNFLVLSPMSKGLFQRAIMMSGSALSPWAVARDANYYAQQIARTLGCPTDQPATLLECLRERSVADILRVQITVPKFLTGFGPTVDGIVIQNEPTAMMEELADEHQFGLFDLMFGVTKVESYFYISEKDEKNGMEVERRDRLLRTLVRNIFSYHLQEIFLTIVNEYTDWTKAVQHDVNTLDGMLDALGDALVVAPIVKSANYHSMSHRKSFFYVFSYQSGDGKFPQRQGCITGEDIQYVFGAPLVGTLGHFSRNYSQQEVTLSEAVMTYWVNFARNGDPNTPPPEKPQERGKNRKDRINWPSYDSIHQKYMLIGLKSKLKDHYHAHRLSFWLNLFPQLHSTSSVSVSPEHHLLDDHDNMESYDGAVRQMPFALTQPPSDDPTNAPPSLMTTDAKSDSEKPNAMSTLDPEETVSTENNTLSVTTMNITDSLSVIMSPNPLSAALSVTIAVGASLLILNVLVFAGICYQRDRTRAEEKMQKRLLNQQNAIDAQMGAAAVANVKSGSLRAPPPSPVCIQPQQELALHPPPPKLHHPHKVPLKPCVIPTPPQIHQRESLSDVQTLMHQGVTTMAKKSPIHQFSQNAQVHFPLNHHEIKL
ncbi:neuroligin-4, X-linked [Trichonephila clavata]|uniref:Neuroligin-4, X-linked n=1 Tax=Trichonephila clavata TaxID=2740835 RepID=A0A8X6FN59_TRICU|nr:neuroligin-4, X-linked [Trichonephila clavata]